MTIDNEIKNLDSSLRVETPGAKENIYSPFNPNTVTQDELLHFGLPVKTAKAWIHYLEKGGKFRYPEDVKKIFGMNESIFNSISAYIRLEEKNKDASRVDLSEKIKKIAVDPNTAPFNDLIQAGFPGKIANTLIHFRSSGKMFKSKHDVSKIYGVTDSLLDALSPYLVFKDTSGDEVDHACLPEIKIPFTGNIDLNKADSNMLKLLPGIGRVLAVRIIAYREKLGGYYSIAQLQEVYGLRDTTLQKIKSNLILTDPYRKIKINRDSLFSLHHPYLSKKDATLIQSFRDQHGQFHSIQDLYQIKAFDQKFWERLQPYLDFDNQ
jgi:competence ComEA-like helix-hairpin-helix protein